MYKKILWIVCAAASLVPLMGSALNMALPHITFNDIKLTTSQSGWIMTAYMLSTAIFQLPAARWADKIGRRTVFRMGLVIFCISTILCAVAWSGPSLIAFRAIMGIGSAMVFATNVAILTGAVPPERRGWALGINTGTVYFSLAAGPFVGGVMTRLAGWHSIFLLSLVIALVVLAGSYFILKENWREAGHTRNNWGALFRNRLFRHGILSALINYAATNSVVFMLTFYLQDVMGLTIMEASGIIICESVIMAVVSLFSGRMSDRVEPRRLAATGMAIVTVGLGALCFITATTPLILIMAILAVLGLGFGIFSSPNMNIIMSSVDRSQYSLASATTGVVRIVGQVVSMGIAMVVMAIVAGNVPHNEVPAEDLLSSIHITFIISAILCALGVYSSSVRNRKLNA